MQKPLLLLALLGGLTVTACANTGAAYEPLLDGPAGPNYSSDLASCQQLATEHQYLNGNTRTDALIGAGLGALAGIADDDVNDTEGAIAGAVVGAIAGAGAGAMEAHDERQDIVTNCLRGRGYRVAG